MIDLKTIPQIPVEITAPIAGGVAPPGFNDVYILYNILEKVQMGLGDTYLAEYNPAVQSALTQYIKVQVPATNELFQSQVATAAATIATDINQTAQGNPVLIIISALQATGNLSPFAATLAQYLSPQNLPGGGSTDTVDYPAGSPVSIVTTTYSAPDGQSITSVDEEFVNGSSIITTALPDGTFATIFYTGPNGTGSVTKVDEENPDGSSQITVDNSGSSTTTFYSGPNGSGSILRIDQENSDGSSKITITNPDGSSTTTNYSGPNGTGTVGRIDTEFSDGHSSITVNGKTTTYSGPNGTGNIIGTAQITQTADGAFVLTGTGFAVLILPGEWSQGLPGVIPPANGIEFTEELNQSELATPPVSIAINNAIAEPITLKNLNLNDLLLQNGPPGQTTVYFSDANVGTFPNAPGMGADIFTYFLIQFGSPPTLPPAPPTSPGLGATHGLTGAAATTNLPNPVLTGTAAPLSTVTLYDGSTQVGTGQANAQGLWVITSNSLSIGSHTLTATAADALGQVSEASPPVQITVDSPTTTRFQLANSSAVLQLGDQSNTVQFGDGVVVVTAGGGVNRITGGNGNDFISVGNGGNTIRLGDGNNQIAIGTGADTIVLGNGNNVILDPPGKSGVTVKLGDGANQVTLGDGDDSVTAGHGPNQITLGNGNDRIQLGGTSGATDKIIAGNGNDRVILGDSQNQVTLGNGNDRVTAGDGNNILVLGFGDDTIALGDGANHITLGDGKDSVSAGNGNNTIVLGGGNDAVRLGNGNNNVTLGGGKDTVRVGDGTNTIILGGGKDTITAGNGMLDLIFTSTTGELTMNHFNATLDDLVFSAPTFDLGADNALATTTPQAISSALFSSNTNGTFATPQNRFAYNQKTGALYYDAGGSAAPASRVLIASLENHPNLTAGDLFFTS